MPQPNPTTLKDKLEVSKEEKQRLDELTMYERKAYRQGFKCVVGIDEAGRGPLAGPVLAAACMIPKGLLIPGVNDSKKLTPKKRFELFQKITNDSRIAYAVGRVDSEDIDRINIFQATIQAMLQAVSKLTFLPDLLLVDGLDLKHEQIPCQKIIGGDALSQSIAAASIIAKETRDLLMNEFHQQWPQYGFDQHKGYGTAKHQEAISHFGPCPIHRFTFEPIKSLNANPRENRIQNSESGIQNGVVA